MEINKVVAATGGYGDYTGRVSASDSVNKDNLTKVSSDMVTFSAKTDNGGTDASALQSGFSAKLENAKTQIASDLEKQQAIDRKEQVKAAVQSGSYVVSAREVAAKMMISGFDFTV